MNEVMFSSKSDIWETPQWLFDSLNEEFNFTLDVCADVNTHKCKRYFTKEIDGLKQDWSRDICWMNPPYGRQIYFWVKKAFEEAEKGATVVALLPARTDTRWFHEFIYDKHMIKFLKGRLKFGKSVNSAPFPSMIIIFKKWKKD